MTNIFILTSARPTLKPFEYLVQLVEEIDDEELPDESAKTILLDGTAEQLKQLRALLEHGHGRWALELFEKASGAFLGGNKPAYWRLLELALEMGDEALVLEDDLLSCTNATTRAVLFPVPSDVDLLQFYSGFSLRHPSTEPGLWRSPATFRGCQAVKFPLRTLRRLVDWSHLPEFGKYVASDQALELARRRLGLRLAHHMPDLYQHAGADSAVDNGTVAEGGITDDATLAAVKDSLTGRTSATWPGRAADAMRLFARHDVYK